MVKRRHSISGFHGIFYVCLKLIGSDLRIISLYVTLRLWQEKSHVYKSANTKGFERSVI